MARKDASTIEEWQMSPADIETMGYSGGMYADVAKACDAWLNKRMLNIASPFGKRFGVPKTGPRPPCPEMDRKIEIVERVAVLKKKRTRNRPAAKYATPEERAAAIRAQMKRFWETMPAEQKAARMAKVNARKPKSDVPRWKRDSWKKYKSAWDRERRKNNLETEEQKNRRLENARKRYLIKRESPEFKAKEKAKRERYRAKIKATKTGQA